MEIALAMGVFFLICILVFVFIALFLPEWIGITGKKAKDVMKEHHESEESKEPPPLNPSAKPH